MILENDEPFNRPRIEFNTIPVSSKIGESKRHIVRICSTHIKSDATVFEEAVKASSLNINAKTMAYLFDAVLSTAIDKTATDGVPRRIGNLLKVVPVLRGTVEALKVVPVLRGTVEAADSDYDPKTCTCYIDIVPLKAAKKKVKVANFRLLNRTKKAKSKA